MRLKIIQNYLSFIEKIKKSEKPLLRQLFSICSRDSHSVTGSNLRHILLQTDKIDIEELSVSTAHNLIYKRLSPDDEWRVSLIQEIIDIKAGLKSLPDGWMFEDLDDIIIDACAN